MEKKQSNEQRQGHLEIKRVYLKDASFESLHAPDSLEREWHPHIDINLQSSSQKIRDTLYEVVLHVTITAMQEDKRIFVVEIEQGGTFTLSGFSEQRMTAVLQAYCPNILFPFVRETIASLVSKGGFPQLLLGPINFDAVYRQKQQALQIEPQDIGKPH